jgi:hypothetical protein
MSEKATIDILRSARQRQKDHFKGIGEPLVELPLDQVYFRQGADGKPILHMRMDHFIDLAEDYAS